MISQEGKYRTLSRVTATAVPKAAANTASWSSGLNAKKLDAVLM